MISACADEINGTLTNRARLSYEAIVYLNWASANILPAPTLYDLPSKLVLTLFAIDAGVKALVGKHADED